MVPLRSLDFPQPGSDRIGVGIGIFPREPLLKEEATTPPQRGDLIPRKGTEERKRKRAMSLISCVGSRGLVPPSHRRGRGATNGCFSVQVDGEPEARSGGSRSGVSAVCICSLWTHKLSIWGLDPILGIGLPTSCRLSGDCSIIVSRCEPSPLSMRQTRLAISTSPTF